MVYPKKSNLCISFNHNTFLNELDSNFLLSRAFSKISRDSLLALVTPGVVGSLNRYFGRLGQMLGTASGLKKFRFRFPRLFPRPLAGNDFTQYPAKGGYLSCCCLFFFFPGDEEM